MTEKEAIKYLEIMKDCAEDRSVGELKKQTCETAIKALEEIQQYREIGTVEEIGEYQTIKRELERYQANVRVQDFLRYFLETIFKGVKHEGFIILTNEDASAYEQYCQIGTVEECREAMEKQKPKKPDYEGDGYADGYMVYDTWICPNCGKAYEVDYDDYEHCPKCGQAIDWSEEL